MAGNFDEAIRKYHVEFVKRVEEAKPHAQKQKEMKDQ